MDNETEQCQMIFRNLETDVDYLMPVGEMWPIIPRIGESVLWTDDEDEDDSFSGKVEDVHWSIGSGDGYSVFICIRPSNNGFHADRASGPDNSGGLPETRPAGEPNR